MYRLAPLILIGLGLAAGCTEPGISSGAPPPPPPVPLPVQVTVGPDNATIVSGSTLQYQAISTSTVASWEWSLSDPARGSISSDGRFTATLPGQLQIRACASNAPAICGAVAATVVGVPASGGAPSVTLTPASSTISPGQTVEFTVTAGNFTTPGWSWISLDNATASIDDKGLLTARRAGVTVVVACATSEPRYCGSAQVRVQ